MLPFSDSCQAKLLMVKCPTHLNSSDCSRLTKTRILWPPKSDKRLTIWTTLFRIIWHKEFSLNITFLTPKPVDTNLSLLLITTIQLLSKLKLYRKEDLSLSFKDKLINKHSESKKKNNIRGKKSPRRINLYIQTLAIREDPFTKVDQIKPRISKLESKEFC